MGTATFDFAGDLDLDCDTWGKIMALDRVLRKFSRELNYKMPHQERITEVNKNLDVLLFYRWLFVIIRSTAN